MPLGTEVNVGPGDVVLDGVVARPKWGTASVHVYCGQTAEWTKTPLGTEVDLSPGHIVLDGVLAPRNGHSSARLFSVPVYCGHGRPSQLLLSSCCTADRRNVPILLPLKIAPSSGGSG